MSPAAHNRFFGVDNFPFFVPTDTDWVRNVFTQMESGARQFWTRMAMALLLGAAMARAGFAWGGWMHKVRR